MSATLTDRYISATLRGVPAEAHDDVRNELTGSIADAVEARIEEGERPDEAERAALNELGDPAVLAAGLADRRLQLIGPRHYLTWLRLLLAIVPASVAVLVALGYAISGAGVGDIIAEGIASGITAGLHVCVWTTLAFAVMDRLGADGSPRWSVDRLPENRSTGRGLADLIAVAILMPAAAFGFVWDRQVGFIFLHGEAYPIWNPSLWPWWMAAVFVLLAMVIGIQTAVFVRGRWTARIAIANTALQVLGASWFLTLLGRGELFNPEMLEVLMVESGVTSETLRVLAVVFGFFGVCAIAAGGIIDCWLKTARDARTA
ncbi:permease prefix domain 1-containing protein [Microbacterium halotolerans]|uniref:permease prefix domain 1-containing protein n=1 Tax=Microbacterium halotolerans TaxID=246613 RepID=UPI000E6AA542|nr:permease prefix domain 1-containing protein [Microbacterium halotolerans]